MNNNADTNSSNGSVIAAAFDLATGLVLAQAVATTELDAYEAVMAQLCIEPDEVRRG